MLSSSRRPTRVYTPSTLKQGFVSGPPTGLRRDTSWVLPSMATPLLLAQETPSTSIGFHSNMKGGFMMADATSDRLELVAEGFSFPTSLTFDGAGVVYLAESGLPFGSVPPGRAHLADRTRWQSPAPGRGAATASQRPDIP